MRSVHGNGETEEAAMSGNLFSLCVRTFIVNENDRPGLVLLGQHTAHVFIESCTISGWVLFSGDVDNTLHIYLFKVVRSMDGCYFQVMWTTHYTCFYLKKRFTLQYNRISAPWHYNYLDSTMTSVMPTMPEILGSVVVWWSY